MKIKEPKPVTAPSFVVFPAGDRLRVAVAAQKRRNAGVRRSATNAKFGGRYGRGAGKALGPSASFLNPADSPVCRGRLISLAIAG